MKTKTVEINFIDGEGLDKEEFKGTVVIRKLNSDQHWTLEGELTQVRYIGKMPQVNMDVRNVKKASLMAGIDFERSKMDKTTYYEDKQTKNHVPTINSFDLRTGIGQLPTEITEELFNAFSELNEISEKKNIE